MSDDRLELHSLLAAQLPGVKLIFRPPSQNVLEYPCVVYDVSRYKANHASNATYIVGTTYIITLMSRLPGYANTKNILKIPGSSHDRTYVSDGIVHDVFTIQTTAI